MSVFQSNNQSLRLIELLTETGKPTILIPRNI